MESPPFHSHEKEKLRAIDIKRELYRPVQSIVEALALFYSVTGQGTLGFIDELGTINVFCPEGIINLKKAIRSLLALRFSAHQFYNNERELFFLLEQDKIQDSSPLLTGENFKILEEIYNVLIPFHQSAKLFVSACRQDAKNKRECFFRNRFYDEGPLARSFALQSTFQCQEAVELYQEAESLNPI